MANGLSYRDAGVDIDAGDALVEAIKPFARRTLRTEVLAAGNAPPAQLAVREDLRSRLGWGLAYQVKPLTDAERAVFLSREAERRGMRLSDDVVWYLLARVRRDLSSLGAILDFLDRVSLEQQRRVTLPLVREALKRLGE